MKAFRIAFGLLLIPRLLISLVFFPLLLSLILVYLQLVLTGVLVKATTRDAAELQKSYRELEQDNVVRRLVFGSGKPFPPPRICRWVAAGPETPDLEVPPSPECSPDRLDIALRAADPLQFEASEYAKIFDGNVERIHVCRTCHPDIVITPETTPIHANLYSIWGLAIVSLAQFSRNINEQQVKTLKEYEMVTGRIGERVLHLKGFRQPITVAGFNAMTALIMNVACLVLITLWLCLKAHRRVLDYFGRSGSLLPLVAACGKNSFYGAIWLITVVRAAMFLLAAVPLSVSAFFETFKAEQLAGFFGGGWAEFPLWLATIIASLTLAAIIASIADLKQRHAVLSFSYKYVPLLICAAGAAGWLLTFLFEGPLSRLLRSGIASTPIAGMAAVLVAPIFKPAFDVLIVHSLLAVIAAFAILKHNARWFAAHLEEL